MLLLQPQQGEKTKKNYTAGVGVGGYGGIITPSRFNCSMIALFT